MSTFEPYKMERAPYPNEFDDGDPRVTAEDFLRTREQLLRRPPLLHGVEIPTVRATREAQHIFHEFGAVMGVGPESSECEWGHPDQRNWEFRDVTHEYGGLHRGMVASMFLFGRHKKDLLIHCRTGFSCSIAIAWGISILRGADPKEALRALAAAQPLDAYGHEQRVIYPNIRVVLEMCRLSRFGNQPEGQELPRILKEQMMTDPRTDWEGDFD